MSNAKSGDTVKVHYTGKLEDGTVFDSSEGKNPLEFTIAAGEVISGFEEAIVGMEVGETKTITVPSDKAYGPHKEDMVIVIELDKFPENIQPKVGQYLEVNQTNGQKFLVEVTDISEDKVTLDANHPLAGKDLTFEIQLVEIV